VAAIDLHQAMARLLLGRGDLEEAAGHVSAARRLMAGTVDPQYVVALKAREAELALWRQRPQDALRAVEAGLRELEQTDDQWLTGELAWFGARAEADTAAAVRQHYRGAAPERARERARALASGLPRLRDRSPTAVTAAHLALARAEAARLDDRPAADVWESAVGAADLAGHPFLLAYARWRQAETLLSERRHASARPVLRAAGEAARRLGAQCLLREIGSLGRREGLAPTGTDRLAVDPGPYPALSPREEEVLALVATGLTNREVAEALFITERTAAAHVSHILAKLGARSRVEATAAAHRHGLA
jgi:DNA-binding CsgD family transcriptional regulator